MAVAVLPEASEATYVRIYVPTSALTSPFVSTVIVPEASVAVAPASVYVVPNS